MVAGAFAYIPVDPSAHIADKAFLREVIKGMAGTQKTLPCKYLYDAEGSALFEEICDLEEYYPTRTEIDILRRHLPEMSAHIGSNARVIEFGAGAGIKTELLLEMLDSPAAYMPIEISEAALLDCTRRLSCRFPNLSVNPVHADYLDDALFNRLGADKPLTVFFPGSTLGNFEKSEALAFLIRMRQLAGWDGGLLIGVDLMKDERILIPAYDDKKGVTAQFNKNILRRINKELGGTFDIDAFAHKAVVNQQKQRVEMHLVSLKPQTVHINSIPFYFTAGESIHTENSHKYSLPAFAMMVEAAGLTLVKTWTDDNTLFAVHYLKPAIC